MMCLGLEISAHSPICGTLVQSSTQVHKVAHFKIQLVCGVLSDKIYWKSNSCLQGGRVNSVWDS